MRRLAVCLLFGLLAATPALAQRQVEVEILNAHEMRPRRVGSTTVFRLLGDVRLRHGEAVMVCDSAHVDQAANTFDAFGHVRIRSKDLRISGDTLYYDGQSGNGRMLGRQVELHDTVEKAYLWANLLFFNTRDNTAHYMTGGRIRRERTNLESKHGYYDSNQKLATVSRAVVYRSDSAEAYGDSIQYFQELDLVKCWGKTRVYDREGMAYGLKVAIDQTNRTLEVEGEAAVDNGANRVYADWLFSNRRQGHTQAKGHVVLVDSLGYQRLYTQHLQYWRSPQLAVADDEPLLFSVDTSARPATDTLFLRMDTLRAWSELAERKVKAAQPTPRSTITGGVVGEKASHRDSIGSGAVSKVDDSVVNQGGASVVDTVRYARAVGRVRAFRRDLQLVADTLYLNGLDSTVTLLRAPFPFVWSDSTQGVAERIVGYFGRKTLDSIRFVGKAIAAIQDDSVSFNQAGGALLVGLLEHNELRRVRVEGDAQLIFFMRDKGDLVGINRVECPSFTAHVAQNKPTDIYFYEGPKSDMIPPKNATQEDRKLFGFEWHDDIRPHSKGDIIPGWLTDFNFYQARQQQMEDYRQKDSPAIQAKRKEKSRSNEPVQPATAQ